MSRADYSPAPVNHPHVKVERAGRVGESRYHLALDRNSVLVDLLVECLAEADDVSRSVVGWRLLGLLLVEPKPHPVEEMKASAINQTNAARVIFSPEEYRGGKDSVKALNDPTVVAPVLGKAKEVEHPAGAVEVDVSAFLLNGERG